MGGFGKVQQVAYAVFLDPLRTHDHADKVQFPFLGGGDEAVPSIAGGAGLDAVSPLIPVADDTPGGQQMVGGVQRPLLAEIGGGDDGLGAVADLHEFRILHGGLGDEIEVPGGGVMIRVVQSAGVDEVGVLAAKGFGLGVHGVHKGGDGAGVPLRQNVAGLVGGDDEHTLQKLLHRHDLPGLDPGAAAVRVVIGVAEGTFRGSDLLIQQCFIAADLFQDQQSRHDLGQAGGIVFLMNVFGIGHGVGVHVRQQRSLGLNVRDLQRFGSGGEKHPGKAGAK